MFERSMTPNFNIQLVHRSKGRFHKFEVRVTPELCAAYSVPPHVGCLRSHFEWVGQRRAWGVWNFIGLPNGIRDTEAKILHFRL